MTAIDSNHSPNSWRLSGQVNAETVLLLGWGRAILLQFAHPLVARGVADHSYFQSGARAWWRRLERTVAIMLATTFGSEAEARQTVGRINRVHDLVAGTLSTAEGRFPAGTRYSARDAALVKWVHATTVDSFVTAYELFVCRLSSAERDAYFRQTAEVEVLFGVPPETLPRTLTAARTYIVKTITDGTIAVTPTARELARSLMWPPLPWFAWPILAIARFLTVGLLPEPVRRGYGFRWDERRQRVFIALATMIRIGVRCTPWRFRTWRAARRASRRTTRRAE